MIQVTLLPHKWLLSAIYASTTYTDLCILWNNLKCISKNYKEPWIAGGNFNEIIRENEKLGGKGVNLSCANNFFNCINSCNLTDLGFKGSKYTWTNNRTNGHTILERLDRIFANYEWINLFPNCLVTHLPRTHSDHCPLLLTLQGFTFPPDKVFRFETIWTSHPDFQPMVLTIWKTTPSPSSHSPLHQHCQNLEY